jgi:hypothetical protein
MDEIDVALEGSVELLGKIIQILDHPERCRLWP